MTVRSSLIVEMSGDEADLKRKQAGIIKQSEDLRRGYHGVAQTAKAGRGDLERFAKEMTRVNATPLERAQEKQAKLNAALQAGLIDQKTYARATAQTAAELEKAERAAEGLADKTKQTSSSAGMAGLSLQGLKDMALGAVTAFAGARGLQVALDVYRQSLQFAREEQDKATGSLEALADSRRRLNQISTSAQDLDALERQADKRAAKFGVDRSAVRQLQFSARSEGFEGATDEILASRFVVDPQAAATVAGQTPSLFKGSITPIQAVNATLAGAKASRLDFEQISRALPSAAEGAGAAGASPEETISALSVLASEFKSGDAAADRIKAFGTKASLDEGKRFEGLGLIGTVEKLSSMSDEERQEFLGNSQEINSAFRKLRDNLELIRSRQETIREAIDLAGTDQSLLAQGRANALDLSTETGRTNAGQLAADRARIAREIANEKQLATTGNTTRAAVDTELAGLKQEDRSTFDQFIASRAGDVAGLLRVGPGATQTATRVGADFGRQVRYTAATGGIPVLGQQLVQLQQLLELRNVLRGGQRASADMAPSSDEAAALRAAVDSQRLDGALNVTAADPLPPAPSLRLPAGLEQRTAQEIADNTRRQADEAAATRLAIEKLTAPRSSQRTTPSQLSDLLEQVSQP